MEKNCGGIQSQSHKKAQLGNACHCLWICLEGNISDFHFDVKWSFLLQAFIGIT